MGENLADLGLLKGTFDKAVLSNKSNVKSNND